MLKYEKDKSALHRFASKITKYQNKIIDKIVLDDYDHIDTTEQKKIFKHLFNLNLIPLSEYFRQISRSNPLSVDELLNLKNEKFRTAENITKEQNKLFFANFNNVGELVNTHEINKPEYRKILKETPNINRGELLRMASDQGINQDLLTNVWSIRDPELLSRNLYREAQMKTDNQAAFMNPNIQSKMWIWSEAENTRHSNMDGDTVPFDDKFEVVNEVTGEVDYMLYPHDPEGSAGNVVNCLCDIAYLETEANNYAY